MKSLLASFCVLPGFLIVACDGAPGGPAERLDLASQVELYVGGTSPSDIWSIRQGNGTSDDTAARLTHYDGSSWTEVAVPASARLGPQCQNCPAADVGSECMAPGGPGELWIAGGVNDEAGAHPVLGKLDVSGTYEDHAADVPDGSAACAVGRNGAVFVLQGATETGIYRLVDGAFQLDATAPPGLTPHLVFSESDAWGSVDGPAGPQYFRFDGGQWTAQEVPLTQQPNGGFGASTTGSNNYDGDTEFAFDAANNLWAGGIGVPTDATFDLHHFDGGTWTTSTVANELLDVDNNDGATDSWESVGIMPAADQRVAVVRNHLRDEGNGDITIYRTLEYRIWDGVTLSEAKVLRSHGELEANGIPRPLIRNPLEDGTLVVQGQQPNGSDGGAAWIYLVKPSDL